MPRREEDLMPRPATGQVVDYRTKHGRVFALRFRAYGKRRWVTLGAADDGWTFARADEELRNVLADVRRGIWRAPEPEPVEEPREEPTFHEFATEWLDSRRAELRPRTIEDYEWALTHHLLPYFARMRLSAITVRDVDRYRTEKLREGVLSAAIVNKTLTRLAQVLEQAVEYDLIAANPVKGRRRRAKVTAPRRTWLEPEQVAPLPRECRSRSPRREADDGQADPRSVRDDDLRRAPRRGGARAPLARRRSRRGTHHRPGVEDRRRASDR
jgi:integrase